jgi:hypothetical protein
MIRAAALLATLLLCACGGAGPLPSPEILSVSPNRVTVPRGAPAAERLSIRISLDAVIPVRVDYGRELVSTEAARAWIGPEEARVETLEHDGTLTVTVPTALDRGTYEVRVILSDGREAVRSSALTVVAASGDTLMDQEADAGTVGNPGGDPDAGTLILVDGGAPSRDGGGRMPEEPMREGDITGFELEPLGDQQRGLPFPVTVRALGPRAAHFQDHVELSVNKNNGGRSPTRLGPFDAGVCVQFVMVDAKGGNVKLTVTDAFGAQGTSNGFKVK